MNLKTHFPHASKTFIALNDPLPASVSQRDQAQSLGQTVQGEKESLGRVTLCYRGFFVRPQDPDNFVASTKDLTDGLWRCGLIHGDNKWQIKLRHEQEKVDHFAQERIELSVTWPVPSDSQAPTLSVSKQNNTK